MAEKKGTDGDVKPVGASHSEVGKLNIAVILLALCTARCSVFITIATRMYTREELLFRSCYIQAALSCFILRLRHTCILYTVTKEENIGWKEKGNMWIVGVDVYVYS